MKTEYTDTTLKQALAKMLPDDVEWTKWTEDALTLEYELVWKKTYPKQIEWNKVLDTELLHLCWLVEEVLSPAEKMQYAEVLADGTGVVDWGYYPGDGAIAWDGVSTILHATWQQRVIALCKVKGITL